MSGQKKRRQAKKMFWKVITLKLNWYSFITVTAEPLRWTKLLEKGKRLRNFELNQTVLTQELEANKTSTISNIEGKRGTIIELLRSATVVELKFVGMIL